MYEASMGLFFDITIAEYLQAKNISYALCKCVA